MINSYYSSYSLEYYEVGAVYSFYTRKGDRFAPVADDELIEKYAAKLDKVEQDKGSYPPKTGKFSNLMRTCGVVVEKIAGDKNGKLDKIRFMIKLIDEDGVIGYGTKLYAVNYRGVETDGWEAMPVETELFDGCFYVGTGQKEPASKRASHGGKGKVELDESTDSKGRVSLDEDNSPGSKKSGSKSKTNKAQVKSSTGVTIDENVDSETGRVTIDE